MFSSSSASPAIGDSTARPPGDWTPAAVPSGIIGIGERVGDFRWCLIERKRANNIVKPPIHRVGGTKSALMSCAQYQPSGKLFSTRAKACSNDGFSGRPLESK